MSIDLHIKRIKVKNQAILDTFKIINTKDNWEDGEWIGREPIDCLLSFMSTETKAIQKELDQL